MIGPVLRLCTIFANMMAGASLALAVTIAVAGVVEKSSLRCGGCLHTSAVAIETTPRLVLSQDARRVQVARGAVRSPDGLE